VFFTAAPGGCSEEVGGTVVVGAGPEVEELYARLGGRETVPISEPLVADCAQCQTPSTVADGRREGDFAGASEDGSKVFFTTEQELFSGDSTRNLYEYDFDNPAGEKVVRVSTGSATPEVEGVARVSEDGSHVYFVAKGVLTGGQANGYGGVAQAGQNNLYVFERDSRYPAGHVTFIAILGESEAELAAKQHACSGSTEEKEVCEEERKRQFEVKNEEDATDWKPLDTRRVQATPDGRFLVFESVADLTPGDTSEQQQIFEYDALSGELVRVSRAANDAESQSAESAELNGSQIEEQSYIAGTSGTHSPAEAGSNLAVSEDGATVVFGSDAALTPEAEAGIGGREPKKGAYEYHSSVATGGTIEDGDVYLIAQPGPSEAPIVDGSGNDVFFLSSSSLVPQDSDTQIDLYDARVDGGLPAPVAPVECDGAGCAPPVAPSSSPAPASAGVAGGGNLVPAPFLPPGPKPPAKPLTRAQKLAKALKACGRDRKKAKRISCERVARKRYGTARKSSGDRGAAR